MNERDVLANVSEVARDFARARNERQRRRHLDRTDFARLADAGFLRTGVPVSHGGLFKSVRESTRPLCQMLHTLAGGDASVALVASMHPAVRSFWLASPHAPPPDAEAWAQQAAEHAQTALAGHWWGTITSEPGSGGDITRTRAAARLGGNGGGSGSGSGSDSDSDSDSDRGAYLLSGAKHFGSGSGIASYMITTAVPEGESEPDLFCMDLRDIAWDGSQGVTLLAEWDGQGMTATQSHAMRFDDYPATRCAWRGNLPALAATAGPFINCSFTAVVLGIIETAMHTAEQKLRPRSDTLRAYEQVEWSRAELEAWLARQAYEGALRAVEDDRDASRAALRGKTAVAELAESILARVCKVLGGGTYSRSSPFAFWYEDVRALGFLRPPWGLAFDQLYASSTIQDD